jgi:cysteine desulfurase
MNVDLLSVSGHKLYGPKGIGVLYVRDGVELEPIIHGGGHEWGMRAGTENVPGIVGLAKAVEIAAESMPKESRRLTTLRDRLIRGVLEIKGSRLNGHPKMRLPNNAHFTFQGMTGGAIVTRLDEKGVAASAASACFTHSTEPPHVLKAIGMSAREANSSLRLTLGKTNSREDVDYVIESLHSICKAK